MHLKNLATLRTVQEWAAHRQWHKRCPSEGTRKSFSTQAAEKSYT